jgi:hypothetical protein
MAQTGSYLEIQAVVGTASYLTSNGWQKNQTSAKFIWGSATTDAYIVPVYGTSWSTIAAGTYTTQTRYYANVSVQTFSGTGVFQVTVYTSNQIYFANINVQIVMIAKMIGSTQTAYFYYAAQAGTSLTKIITNNFNATATTFGYPQLGGNCIVGMKYIDLMYDPNANIETSFSFNQPAQEVTDLLYSSQVLGVKVDVVCLTVCAAGLINSNGNCVIPCPSFCYVCATTTQCTTCMATYFLRADNLCYSNCLGGTFPNSGTGTCNACPSGCSACTGLSSCSSCSAGSFLRADNLCYSTCLSNFFANTATGNCTPCITGCTTCPNTTYCSVCSTNYFLRSDNLCYTSCLTGTFENTTTHTCILCPSGCSSCLSSLECQICAASYFLRADKLCYSSCLSGFFTNTTAGKCDACPLTCSACLNVAYCTACQPLYLLGSDFLCHSNCSLG